MNEEEAFQAHLDAHPEDHICRLVFSDWLRERDDPRADGYMALGALRRRPTTFGTKYGWHNADELPASPKFGSALIRDWWNIYQYGTTKPRDYAEFDCVTRREAEDSAALAFARLSPERQAELLAVTAGAA